MTTMETYTRVWDALTTPDDADDLQARAEHLHALQRLITDNRWDSRAAAAHLELAPARADALIAGDITEFSLTELQRLTHHTALTIPPQL